MSGTRSLADAIRGMDADRLTRAFALRPDLARPVPTTLTEVADRAAMPASTRACVDRLDTWQRQVATAFAAMPDGQSARTMAALLRVETSTLDRAVRDLADQALAWKGVDGWRVTASVRQVLGPWPAGLAPVSVTPLSDSQIDAALAAGGPEVRSLLERLLWELPVGQVRDADRRGSGDSPADRAIALRLLRPWDTNTAILPREVSLRLRGGRLFEHPALTEIPAWPPVDPDSLRRADPAGVGNAYELVRLVEQSVDVLTTASWHPLAHGGLAKHDAATVARLIGSEPLSRFVLSLARHAGLFASAGREWLPTHGFDDWAESDDLARWRALVEAWRTLPDWPGHGPLLGTGQGPAWAIPLRSTCFDQVLAAEPGTPVLAPDLTARVRWLRPTLDRVELEDDVRQVIDELTWLGFLALGRRTGVGVDPGPSFPERTDRLIVQADLTAVAGGPLVRDVAVALALIADRESLGGGGVYRFTPDSIRRAFDAGWSTETIRGWLADHSLTPVPQPLDYLVGDVAARHGSVQVSAVATAITVDDPALLEALLHDPRAGDLGLRRIGVDVLGTDADPDEVVPLLRRLGHAPVARDATGRTAVTPVGRRASAPAEHREDPLDDAALRTLASTLLARDDPQVSARSAEQILDLLTHSVATRAWLEVDRVLDDGTPRSCTARVMALSGGQVRLQQRAAPMITVPVSRIVGVRRLGARAAHGE